MKTVAVAVLVLVMASVGFGFQGGVDQIQLSQKSLQRPGSGRAKTQQAADSLVRRKGK